MLSRPDGLAEVYSNWAAKGAGMRSEGRAEAEAAVATARPSLAAYFGHCHVNARTPRIGRFLGA